MTTQNESPKRLTVIESSLTPCPYNRLWLVQIPEDGWDRFECIVDDSGLRSPELPGPLEARENGVEFVREEYAEDLLALLAMVGCKTVEDLAGQYRGLCAKVVFGQIDGTTIDKAEEVLQKWNGDR